MTAFLSIGQPKIGFDTNILSIKVPEEMKKAIPTGHPYIDKLYAGDGVIAGTVSLVTGDAGAGKSTLMVTLADCLMASDHLPLYVTGEESLYQVSRVVDRLGLKYGFIPSYNVYAQDIIEQCEKLKAKYKNKKVFLFLDSLQCVRVHRDKGQRGRPSSDKKQIIEGLQMLTEYCKNNWIPFFAIGHITKKGEFAGDQIIKHIVDAHLHLEIEQDSDSGMQERFLCMEKNRFGISGTCYPVEMTERGLNFNVKKAKPETSDEVEQDDDSMEGNVRGSDTSAEGIFLESNS